MSHVLGECLTDQSDDLVRKLAMQLACDVAVEHYEGQVPNLLHRYYEVQAFAAIRRALDTLQVPSAVEWLGEFAESDHENYDKARDDEADVRQLDAEIRAGFR